MLHSFKIHDDEESFPTIYTFVVDRYKVIIKNNFIFIKSDKNFLELEDFRSIILFCSNSDRIVFNLIIKKIIKLKFLTSFYFHIEIPPFEF